MRHLNSDYHYTCATCDNEIDGKAVFHLGLPFCCSVCAAGRPCNRSNDKEAPDDERSGNQAVFG